MIDREHFVKIYSPSKTELVRLFTIIIIVVHVRKNTQKGTSLSDMGFFTRDYDHHTLYVDDNSQNSGKVGNDAFITTQYNPMLQKILSTALENYNFDSSRLDEDSPFYLSDRAFAFRNSLPIMNYDYDKAKYILEITPFKTGPYCVRKNTQNAEDDFLSREECGSDILSLKEFTYSKENGRGWVGKAVRPMSFEDALASVIKTIDFEKKQLSMLRLDDHVSNLMESSNCRQSQAVKGIIDYISSLDLNDFNCIQISFSNQETFEFCKEASLLNKTFLFPLEKYCVEMTDQDHYYFELPIESIANIEIVDALVLKAIHDPSENIDLLVELSNRQIDNYISFCNEASDYCVNLLEKLISRDAESHLIIISSYLNTVMDGLCKLNSSLDKFSVENELDLNPFVSSKDNLDKTIIILKEILHSYKLEQYLDKDIKSVLGNNTILPNVSEIEISENLEKKVNRF